MQSFINGGFGLFFVFFLVGCVIISFQCCGNRTEVREPEAGDKLSSSVLPDEKRLPGPTEVVVPELGLTLEVPKEASRIDSLWKWEVPGIPEGQLGFNYKRLKPPMEPESVLPGSSLILESEVVVFEWGRGRSYTMEIYAPIPPNTSDEKAPVESIQHHIVITVDIKGQRFILDFFAGASDAEVLPALKPLLQRMAESVGKTLNHKKAKDYL